MNENFPTLRSEVLAAAGVEPYEMTKKSSRNAYFGSAGSGVTLAFGGSACIVMSVIETKS